MTSSPYTIASAAISDRGLNTKRAHNEDSFLDELPIGLFVVADGVGGAQAGEVASQTAVDVLKEAFSHAPENIDVEDLMEIAIQRANSAIYQMSQDVSRLSSMATTLVALQLSGNIATIGHVGDSRLYRLDSKGNLFRETHDHSVVEEELRAGRLTPDQAVNHPSRNVISRALGADDSVEVDMKTIMFEPGSSFLLCSDGITRHIPDQELRELIAGDTAPRQVCDRMKELCYSRGAEDNLTAVVIKTAGASALAQDDFDEATVSSIKPSVAAQATLRDIDITMDGSPTAPLQPLQPSQPETPAQRDGLVFEIDKMPAREPKSPTGEVMAARTETVPAVKKRGSVVEDIRFAFALARIGGALGAGGFYSWQYFQKDLSVSAVQPAAPVPVAEDYYQKGRSLLREKKYAEAIQSFTKARETLDLMTDEDHRKMLEKEINLTLQSATEKEIESALEREKQAGGVPNTANTRLSPVRK